MATTSVPATPTPSGVSVGSTNRQLVSDLNFLDRSFERQLVKKYPDSYSLIMELIGQGVVEAPTDNQEFYHYENRRIHPFVTVQTASGAVAQGANVTLTITPSSHYTSGTTSPLRVGEILEIASSGAKGQIVSVNKTTANAHTVTLTPVNENTQLVSSGVNIVNANEVLLFRGNFLAGEASTAMDGLSPIIDKITNTTTEIRDDFRITDRAAMEKLEVDLGGGNQYYTYLGVEQMNQRFLHTKDFTMLEGQQSTLAGKKGTLGVIPRVAATAPTVGYTAGSFNFAKLQEMTRLLDFQGAPNEFHWLQDINQYQEVTNVVLDKFNAGGIVYDSLNGSKEASIVYGFSSIELDGYTFHRKKNPNFTPQRSHGIPSGSAYVRNHFGLLIPQKLNLDAKTGKQFPSMQLVHQSYKGQKHMVWESGALAEQNKTDKMELLISQICYMGVRVFASNQFMIVKA